MSSNSIYLSRTLANQIDLVMTPRPPHLLDKPFTYLQAPAWDVM